jgi:hypothetical protein
MIFKAREGSAQKPSNTLLNDNGLTLSDNSRSESSARPPSPACHVSFSFSASPATEMIYPKSVQSKP